MTDQDQNNNPEETGNSLPEDNQFNSPTPERHGCVTAWLIFMLIANSIVALIYLFTINKLEQTLNISLRSIALLIILSALNTIFSIMLLSWKKIGFYGFAITAVIALVINIMIGISPMRALIGLAGFAILYAILQIKKDGISAWQNLK